MADEEKRPGGQAGALPEEERSEKKSSNLSSRTERRPTRRAPLSSQEEREIDEMLDAMQEEQFAFWIERRDIPGDWEDEA